MKIILLALLLIIISSTTFLAVNSRGVSGKNFEDGPSVDFDTAPLPVRKLSTFPILSAEGVIVTDLGSGTVLYEKSPDVQLLPASTTKIVTAQVALDFYGLEDVLTAHNLSVAGRKMGLSVGEQMTVKDLLYGLLVNSANDAAEVLAQNYPGGRSAFVEAMNLKAAKLGATSTTFKNPTGLDELGHVTTARDLEKIAAVAMKNSFFADIVNTQEAEAVSVDGKKRYKFSNINELLGKVPGVIGIKTGWTEAAKEALVTYVERDGRKLVFVVLASQDRFGETEELIDWSFKNYTWQNLDYGEDRGEDFKIVGNY